MSDTTVKTTAAVNPAEMFPVVAPDGTVIGSATRAQCHDGSMLLHPVVHLHVIDSQGHIMLQQRSQDKDIQPGKWDTAVGGHVDLGEDVASALLRESREELGLTGIEPVHLMDYIFESDRERELVHVHYLVVDPFEVRFTPDPTEVQRIAWWSYDEVAQASEPLNGQTSPLTPNFIQEFRRILPLLPR